MLPVAAAPSVTAARPPIVAAPAAPLAGADAGSVEALGGKRGRGLNVDMKKLLIFTMAGAAAGTFIPVIPGGPLGGALAGAALAILL